MLTLIGCVLAACAVVGVVGAVIVLPLLAIAFVIAIVVGVVLAIAGAVTLALSPLLWCLGLAWLIWRVARGPRRGATIAA